VCRFPRVRLNFLFPFGKPRLALQCARRAMGRIPTRHVATKTLVGRARSVNPSAHWMRRHRRVAVTGVHPGVPNRQSACAAWQESSRMRFQEPEPLNGSIPAACIIRTGVALWRI